MVERNKAIEGSILVEWLRDSSRKASLVKAIRAIMTTPGREMMYDLPRGIYEDARALPKRKSRTGDIWGGNVLLTHRIELLSMVSIYPNRISHFQIYDLSTLCEEFLKPRAYIETLVRRLDRLDQHSLGSFLLV